ncbi:hypothetical protein QEH59_11350 [Coraliomargarita sp. SDUM461004]|uniref:Uncharacterized protein n=1 Tax=Thalassobacterium sedimentorum TaxID=3041258 RepID=A0ABU1AMF0_9BACT|nr:hypothetical protein [Coraliomargarita sp. SDUM461004]MDQ8195025.1 hypothetical protein [Coraliomargarita sp. SDUM461004]
MKQPLTDEQEKLIRKIYSLACESGISVLGEAPDIEKFRNSPLMMKDYTRAKHKGFQKAQLIIGEELIKIEKAGKAEKYYECLLRKLADTIAWQLISYHGHIARRLYKKQKSPTLSTSNYESLVKASKYVIKENLKFALISDLTSFIQVGDLLIVDPLNGKGLSFAEVKEGQVNDEIINLIHDTDGDSNDKLKAFISKRGKSGLSQLNRVMRQAQRMDSTKNIINDDHGVDSDTGMEIRINAKEIEVENLSQKIEHSTEIARTRGWATDIIDDCMFIGSYTGKMRHLSKSVFDVWFHGSGGNQEDPNYHLALSISSPTSTPIFAHLGFKNETKFDLIQHRTITRVALHIDSFMELSESIGLKMRWGTRREIGKFAPYIGNMKRNGRPLVAEIGDTRIPISDALLTRITFDLMTPRSFLTSLLSVHKEVRKDS